MVFFETKIPRELIKNWKQYTKDWVELKRPCEWPELSKNQKCRVNACAVSTDDIDPGPKENISLTRICIDQTIDQSSLREEKKEEEKDNPHVEKSSHTVSIVKKYKKDGVTLNPGLYWYKENNIENSPISEYEAAICRFYRFLSPETVSKCWAVTSVRKTKDGYDEIVRVGVLSKGIPNFKNLIQDPLTQADIEKYAAELAKALVLSYIMQEDDLHRGNMSKKGKRVDFDGSLWPLLSLIKGKRWFNSHDDHGFKVFEHDLRELPSIAMAQPAYWPSLYSHYSTGLNKNCFSKKETSIFQSLKDFPLISYIVKKELLRFILTDRSNYKKMASLDIREDTWFELTLDEIDEKTKRKKKIWRPAIEVFADHMQDRINEFRKVLIYFPEFRVFVKDNAEADGVTVLDEILREFDQHNKRLKGKPYAAEMTADLDLIQEKFRILVEDVKKDKTEIEEKILRRKFKC